MPAVRCMTEACGCTARPCQGAEGSLEVNAQHWPDLTSSPVAFCAARLAETDAAQAPDLACICFGMHLQPILRTQRSATARVTQLAPQVNRCGPVLARCMTAEAAVLCCAVWVVAVAATTKQPVHSSLSSSLLSSSAVFNHSRNAEHCRHDTQQQRIRGDQDMTKKCVQPTHRHQPCQLL